MVSCDFLCFLFKNKFQKLFSANTGTNIAHNHISLISALCRLKRLFDMYELNAIRHSYIWYSW